ncbi:MAG TPA: pectinesterase family protein [Vicinamibacterales bacterium]|jgi:pectinesterase
MRRRDFLAVGLGVSAVHAVRAGAWPRETQARPSPQHPAAKPVRLVLVGDSTVTDGSGWGFGFKQFLGSGAECLNSAANGRSSKSFIDEGRWRDALAARGDYYLIQFGHNDEPGKGPDRETDPLTTYSANLSRYVDEARAIGATPVLITSLTRRRFTPAGAIVPNLDPYVAAVKAVAAAKRVAVLDLHQRSIELAEQLGDEAWTAMSPRAEDGTVDRTHLNTRGSLRVAPLVIAELRATIPVLAPLFRESPLANAFVAADGGADYTTVQDAINALPQNTRADRRWTIMVRAGTYRELVYVQREKRFVTLVGEDPTRTTITFDLHANRVGLDGKPIGTYRTPTVVIDADDFIVEGLTLENAAGPVGQALALRVDGDRVAFRNCRFLGWQDTIFIDRGRQYFEDVFIAGHVDFIFGGATAYFERAHIHCWRDGYVTAASTPPEHPHGFVFANGRITGHSPNVRSYLGRPWRDFAQVAFLDTQMSEVVRPEGWHNWDRPERERTVRYAEFGSTGSGGRDDARVGWAKRLTRAEAAAMTPAAVLGGTDQWDPTAVPAQPCEGRATGGPPPEPPGLPKPG